MRGGGHHAADGVAFVKGGDAIGGVDTVGADKHQIGANTLQRTFGNRAVHRMRFVPHGTAAHHQGDIFIFCQSKRGGQAVGDDGDIGHPY